MKNIMLLLLALVSLSCNRESLTIQTEFPFTASAETLPTTVKVGNPVDFQLTISPERLTTASAYTLKYRVLSDEMGSLSADGTSLPPGESRPVSTLKPTLRFVGIKAATYQFSIVVTDQAGTTQEVPLSLQVN